MSRATEFLTILQVNFVRKRAESLRPCSRGNVLTEIPRYPSVRSIDIVEAERVRIIHNRDIRRDRRSRRVDVAEIAVEFRGCARLSGETRSS